MGTIDNADNKFNAVVSAIVANPLFHLALPLIAGVILYTEKHVPNLKEGVAGALLLLANMGRVLSSVMGFVSGASKDPQQK